MNSTEIFTLALGLKSAWEIKDVELLITNDHVAGSHHPGK